MNRQAQLRGALTDLAARVVGAWMVVVCAWTILLRRHRRLRPAVMRVAVPVLVVLVVRAMRVAASMIVAMDGVTAFAVLARVLMPMLACVRGRQVERRPQGLQRDRARDHKRQRRP